MAKEPIVSDRFAGVARGRALRGSRAIAEYVLCDADASEIACRLPRQEFGLIVMGRDLVGYTGWIDHALAARAERGHGRRRAPPKAKAEAEPA
jgi:hypothetical protein